MERGNVAKTTTSPTRPRKGRRGQSALVRLRRSAMTIKVVALLAAFYLRLVKATTRFVFEPESLSDAIAGHLPFIGVGWHGQLLLLPTFDLAGQSFDALVSHHADGELMARVISHFGHGTVRGSGSAKPKKMHEKGGISAFRAMKLSLDEGRSIVATADFQRDRPRQVSRGIVSLARVSGRPIFPIAIVTRRRRKVVSWDQTTINLPFSRGAVVIGNPIYVPADADDREAERLRLEIEARINASIARARQLADGEIG